LQALNELATNLRWSWHAPTRALFASVDADVWESAGQDPVRLLGEVSPARLAFLRRISHGSRPSLSARRSIASSRANVDCIWP
jgi:glucan phosphorylase